MTDYAYLTELQGVCRQIYARLGDHQAISMMSALPKNGYPSVPPVRGVVTGPIEQQAQSSEAFLADFAASRSAAIAGVGATAEATKANMRALLRSEGDAGDDAPSLQANMRRQLGLPG